MSTLTTTQFTPINVPADDQHVITVVDTWQSSAHLRWSKTGALQIASVNLRTGEIRWIDVPMEDSGIGAGPSEPKPDTTSGNIHATAWEENKT